MRCVVIHAPGDHRALKIETRPDPVPGPGQVLVSVEACGVNCADAIIRMGLYASARQLHGYPITPGFEVAGRISALGDGVDAFEVGQRVLALTLFNGYSSHIAVDHGSVFACPASLDATQAATLPTVFLTAWFMLHRQVHPRPGDRVLVHSAAGGVGSALVQLGRLAGCEVVGVVGSSHKVDYCRSLGAQVIDKSTQDLWSVARELAPAGFHAIFDANGVSTLRQSYAHLAPTGVLAVYGFHSMLPRSGRLNWLRLAWDWMRTPRFNPMDMTQANKSVVAANLSFLQSHATQLREGMEWLLARFDTGALQPLPVESFALHDVALAHRRIESGQTQGKLALIP